MPSRLFLTFDQEIGLPAPCQNSKHKSFVLFLGLAVLEPFGGLHVLTRRVNVEGTLAVLLEALGALSTEYLVLHDKVKQTKNTKQKETDYATVFSFCFVAPPQLSSF